MTIQLSMFDNPTDEPAGGLLARAAVLFAELDALDVERRIDVINDLRGLLHEHSPMRHEPVDYVRWVRAETVEANDYNPNHVARPEMDLLAHSITADGYTQPIVTAPEGDKNVVVDGFHRHRVGKENREITERIHQRLPVVVINKGRGGRSDRQAATVRHNRARGEHTVTGMSDLVVDMARNGKTDEWIAHELGMDADEVLRLRQVAGLAETFADAGFNEAWDFDDEEET